MISRDNNLLNISKLCKVADVSRSGFYSWRKNKDKREAKEEKDRNDFELILEAYRYRGFDKGARSIHMRLLHTGVRMNIKKIRRLMKKFNLKCSIRKANPYRRMAKSDQYNIQKHAGCHQLFIWRNCACHHWGKIAPIG